MDARNVVLRERSHITSAKRGGFANAEATVILAVRPSVKLLKEGEGVENHQNLADVIYYRTQVTDYTLQSEDYYTHYQSGDSTRTLRSSAGVRDIPGLGSFQLKHCHCHCHCLISLSDITV